MVDPDGRISGFEVKPVSTLHGLNLQKKLAFLAKDSAVYGAAAALNKAFALVTFPVLTWNLSIEQFGAIDLYNTVVTVLTICLVMGQDSAVARYFFEYDDSSKRRQLISQSLAYQLFVIVLFLPLVAIALHFGGSSVGLPTGDVTTIILVVLQAVPLMAVNFSQNILKWTLRRNAFLVVSLGSTVVTTGGLIAALIWWNTSVVTVFIVYLITRVIFAVVGLWLVRDWLCIPKGWKYFKQSLPFALSFGVMGILNSLTPMLERASIAGALDAHSLGLYSAGAKVAMLLSLPIGAFQTAWGPFAYATFREPDGAKLFRLVLRIFTSAVLISVIVLTMLSPLIIKGLAPAAYAASSIFVIWLALGRAIEGIGWISEIGISLAKKAHWKIVATVVGLIVTSIGLWTLIPIMGALGTSLAVLLGITCRASIEAFIAERLYPIGWEYSKIGLMTLLTVFYGFYYTSPEGPLNSTLLTLFGFFIITLILLVAFDKKEWKTILNTVPISVFKNK
jgi:O-antigen/teichoic acid export membrane protein